MKKLFLLLALLGMVAVGCSKDEVDKGNDNKTEQPNENEGGSEDNIPENIFFGLDKESVTISPDGGSVDVVVYSNYKWEISGVSDWCTPSVKKGDANEDGQKVSFSADVAYDDREATFWFCCADEKIKFVVSQKLKAVIIPDANNSFNIPAEGGVAVISYQTTVDCEIIIPEEAQDWITIAPATRGLVSENINLDIAENTTYDSRSAVIKVVAKDNAEFVVEYTINQEQKDAFFADENNVFTVPSAGGEVVIKYQTNVDCEVVIPEEAQDWITIAPSTRGLVVYNTTLNIATNYSNKQRSCVVKVVSRYYNELFAEYTITQNMMYYLCYTSSNGKVVEPGNSLAFGATILSNTYKDGVGIIEFNAPITIIGERAFYDCDSLTSVTIPDSVTTIGDYAFEDCSSLTSVTIGDSVTKIGDWAFYYCSSLTSVYISDIAAWCNISFSHSFSNPLYYANNLYLNNELVTDLTIPDSVTTIGDVAFNNCSSLTSVTIPDSVTTIGDNAFWNCSRLTSVTIGESVTTIGNCAFYWCGSLTSVTIPDSVTTIGDYAFFDCSRLTSVYITDLSAWCRISFEDSSANPLYYAGNLYLNNELVTDLVIPSDVTEIKNYAFNHCSSLTSVTIGDSVTTIGYEAFNNCSSLTSITIPDSVTTIGVGAFWNCTSLTSVTIPDSVTTIGDWAFTNCSSLTSITIPDSVTTIGGAAFADCSSLTSVTIPNSVTTIGGAAFLSCSSLTSITIPDSVTAIGYNAFYNCGSLTSVYCKAVTPPAGGSGMFNGNASGRKIYVPTESVEAYKSASGWSEYKSYIVGYNL